MSNNSFTYVINSRDGLNSTSSAQDLNIILNSLPNDTKFLCEVKSFSLNVGSMTANIKSRHSQLFLCSNNFVTSNETMSGNKGANVIAFCDTTTGLNNNVGIKFIINNFNGRMINFTLYDTRFITVDNAELNQTVNTVVINTAWTLILQLTPIDNDPNNYQLRHGL